MSQGTKQQAVRLPVELHAKIVAAATENNRSGHAEMLHRLEQSFTESSGIVRGDLNALEERLLKKLAPETQPELRASSHGGEYNARKLAHARAQAAEFRCRANALDDSVPEISGLNTLPQAMPKKRHSGGFVSQPAGEVPQILERGEHPSLRHLITPGALDWDNPSDGWTENTGSMPVQPNTMVKWRVRGGFGNTPEDVQGPEPASAIDWTLEDEPDAFDIMLWRLA